MRISDWSSDVCSSDLPVHRQLGTIGKHALSVRQAHIAQSHPAVDRAFDPPDRDAQARSQRHELNLIGDEASAGAGVEHHHERCGKERKRGEAEAEPQQQTRSEEHTSELQSLMRLSYAVFCLK